MSQPRQCDPVGRKPKWSRACRPFTVLDALLLIAALAVSLAWARFHLNCENGGESYPHSEAAPGLHPALVAAWWVDWHAYALIPVTAAVLGLRLRRPRPSLRRLARQPGAVACAAVTLSVAVQSLDPAVETLVDCLDGSEMGAGPLFLYLFTVSHQMTGFAVALAWGLMALGGRWRGEAGWLDRCGLILGVFWLVFPPVDWAIQSLELIIGFL